MKRRDAGVYPKFVRYKNLKNKPYKVGNRYYRPILLDEITTKNRSIHNFKKQLYEAETALHESTTWLKKLCITCTLSNVGNKQARKLKTSLEKTFSKILKDAKVFDGTYPNPNVTITNLSSRILTNDEYEILQYSLKHVIAIKPRDSEIFAIAEDIYDRIDRKGLCKENQISILLKRGELTEEQYKNLRPQNARAGRAHALPKIHKTFTVLPKFRPIVHTTSTCYYNVGSYLTELLNPLTQNEFIFRDSFDAANKIRSRGFC